MVVLLRIFAEFSHVFCTDGDKLPVLIMAFVTDLLRLANISNLPPPYPPQPNFLSPPPPLRPPPPPPDVPHSAIDDFFGKSSLITDASLRDAAVAYLVWFFILLISFALLQSKSILYRFRLVRWPLQI